MIREKTKKRKALVASMIVFILGTSLLSPLTYGVRAQAAKITEISSWAELQETLKADADDEETATSEMSFKLADDLTAGDDDKAIHISDGQIVTIDLAGFNMDRGLTDEDKVDGGSVIDIATGGVLILTDTTDSPGTITGGANTKNGGGIALEDGAELTITGGVKVTGNRAYRGGGVYLGEDCELILGKCTIQGNDTDNNGGGIYGGKSHISFLGGLTKVNKNTRDGDTDNDLYMPADMENLRFWTWSTRNEKTRKQVYSDAMTKGSRVGILLEEIGSEISEGYGKCNKVEASDYFFYDNDDYKVSSDTKASEITIERNKDEVRNNTKTVLEVYKNKKLKFRDEYSSFPDAFSDGLSADGDAVVILGGDYSSDTQIVVTANKEITIDLNGHYIKRNRNYSTKKNGGVILVKAGATLTVKDSNPKIKGYDGVKGGVITGGASSNAGGGITIEKKGHLNMKGGTIYDCVTDEDGGGIYVTKGSMDTTCTITGGRIYHCRTVDSMDECFGGGIYFGEGVLSISDATLDNNYSEDDGGAIYSKRGEIYLNNVIFSGNKAMERGGAIYVDYDMAEHDGTTIYAEGCTFINNEAAEDGGAICIRDNPRHDASMTFDRCVFRDNSAGEDGGAIEVLDDGVVLSNVEITKNTAKELGGGVFVDARYDINVKGVVVIKDNTSKEDSATNDLCLEDGISNTASVYSGGLVRGSYIGIGSTSSKSIRLAKKMSVYEMKYFHANKGSIGPKSVSTVSVDMAVTASLFSEGKWIVMLFVGGLGILVALAAIFYRKYSVKRVP